MNEPTWIVEARKHIGTKEIPGPASNSWIKSMWLKLKGGDWFWKAYGEDDSKLPWCGAFVAYCLQEAGIAFPAKYASAKEWMAWGMQIGVPVIGCVVVFEREGGGHVGFVVGQDQRGRLMVLGGNQGDSVSIAPFDRARLAGYRWPAAVPVPKDALPILASVAQSSTNEA